MSDWNKRVRETIKKYGDKAPERFGVKKTTLDGYLKRGKFPIKLVEAVLKDSLGETAAPEPEPLPPKPEPIPIPPQPTPPQPSDFTSTSPYPSVVDNGAIHKRVEQIVGYIQSTIDVYLKQFSNRIQMLEKEVGILRAGQMRAAIGVSSLARPDQNVPVDQTFTTNPLGNALDSGIAPTKEMVDAQANMAIIEGVPVPGSQLARPADFLSNQPSFGFGWNQPRPRN